KGTSRGASGYSAFESTRLLELLRERGVDHLTVTGLATDVCVRHTALDALKAGLRISIPTTAVRGIDAQDSDRSLEELARAGAEVVRATALRARPLTGAHRAGRGGAGTNRCTI